jgi:RNA polymerase sigma factor (sigma-70 family)
MAVNEQTPAAIGIVADDRGSRPWRLDDADDVAVMIDDEQLRPGPVDLSGTCALCRAAQRVALKPRLVADARFAARLGSWRRGRSQRAGLVRLADWMASDPMRWHPDTKTDQRLLDEARHGRAESFEVVYRRHHAVVLAFLARRAQQPELAADLMAETFAALLVLVRDPDRALPPVPVAWLLVTARNLLIDSHRRGCVDDAARRWLGMRPVALDDRDLERVEEISAEVDLLERLASQLEPEQLAALRARVLDEREYSEIAAEMKCSESVVRKRVSRALGVLRRALEVSGNA